LPLLEAKPRGISALHRPILMFADWPCARACPKHASREVFYNEEKMRQRAIDENLSFLFAFGAQIHAEEKKKSARNDQWTDRIFNFPNKKLAHDVQRYVFFAPVSV